MALCSGLIAAGLSRRVPHMASPLVLSWPDTPTTRRVPHTASLLEVLSWPDTPTTRRAIDSFKFISFWTITARDHISKIWQDHMASRHFRGRSSSIIGLRATQENFLERGTIFSHFLQSSWKTALAPLPADAHFEGCAHVRFKNFG